MRGRRTVMGRVAESTLVEGYRLSDTKIGNGRIIINPKKFQFCELVVEFAGFLIKNDDVKPLPDYLDAIKNFPRPTNISHIRAWFGLVNQVSHYAQLTAIATQFKPLLSPKTRYSWDDALENAIQQSRDEINKAIEIGVKIFDTNCITLLSPHWSKGRNRIFPLPKVRCMSLDYDGILQ